MKFERLILDVETQKDFFDPDGAAYTSEANLVANNIYRLFAWARNNQVPVISTVLRVRRDRIGPLARVPHCVEGSRGEQKLERTILPNCINLGLRNVTDLPEDLFDRHPQVVFEKRSTDIFAHSRAERLITELEGGTFILCGAGLARGIVEAAVGLRTRGFSVVLASDAVLGLNDPLAQMACLRMEAKGVVFAPTEKIIVPVPRRRGAPFRAAVESRR